MWRSLWGVAAAVLLACGCEERDVVVNPPPAEPPVVNVYPTTTVLETTVRETNYVYETTIIREEDTTPDVVTVYEWTGSDFPAIICEEEGLVSKKVSDLVAATALADPDLLLISQGGISKKITVRESIGFPLPPNHISGLITAYGDGAGGGDTDHDATIRVGKCRSLADDSNMVLAAALTKQTDAAWAVGTNAGGMDAGAVAANTLYAVWLIRRSDTGVVDALFSTSFTAPAMPANYDYKRLIGAVKTDATSDIIHFRQSGDQFRYVGNTDTIGPQLDINDATIAHATWETGTLVSVPPHCLAFIIGSLDNPGGGVGDGYLWIRPRPSDASVSFAGDPLFAAIENSGTFDHLEIPGSVLVNSAQQIDYAAKEVAGAATIKVYTWGFEMLTRRDPQ